MKNTIKTDNSKAVANTASANSSLNKFQKVQISKAKAEKVKGGFIVEDDIVII